MNPLFPLLLAATLVGCHSGPTSGDTTTRDTEPSVFRRVLVVDEHTAPVAGAEVAIRADFDPGGEPDPRVDCELSFAGLPRHRSGADGVVQLPTDLACAAVIARAGERFGAAKLEFDDRAVAMPILRIAPDRHVRVLVRGPDGGPRRGVPIQVVVPSARWRELRGGASTNVMGTDDQGRLTIWHAQTLCGWDLARPLLTLSARVIGADSPGVEVDLRHPVADPVELTCPAFGNFVVHRWLSEGVRDGASPDLRAWWIPSDRDVIPESAVGSAADDGSGTWRSRPVGLGQQWRINDDGKVVEVEGPSRDLEQVRVDLFESVPPSNLPRRVSATVVLQWPGGTPCANETVILGDPDAVQHDWIPRVRTDARGRAWFAMDRPTYWFRFYVAGANLVAGVRAPAAGEHGEILDLGTLQLRAPRRLVSGRLVDATTHQPVRGTIDLRGGARVSGWPTAADGTFTLWDDPHSTNIEGTVCNLEVSPRDRSYRGATRKVAIGASEVVVELERTRVLRCTLLVDAYIDSWPLTVRWRDADGQGDSLSSSRSRSGCMVWSGVIPDGASDLDSWTLSIDTRTISMAGLPELDPLHSVSGSAFRPNPDGFEVEVDLRGRLAEFDLFCKELRDYELGSFLLVRSSGSEDPWRPLSLQRRTTVVGRAGTRLEVIVCPLLSPSAQLVLSPGLTNVTLPPPPVLDLDVQAPPVPDERLCAYVVVLERSEPWLDAAERDGFEDEQWYVRDEWPLDADRLEDLIRGRGSITLRPGRQRVELPRLGRYLVLPYVWQDEGRKLLIDDATVCAVEAPGEIVHASLRLDPERLRAALSGK